MMKITGKLIFISAIFLSIPFISSCNKDKDKDPPVITLLGTNPAIAGQGIEYVDAGATATDQEDGNITDKIIVNNEVNTADTGTYYVRYNVQDEAGNQAQEVVRTVNVIYF